MKKLLLVFALFFVPTLVFARGYHNRRIPPPPVITPLPTSTVQWGAFTGNSTVLGAWKGVFIGDGNSFTEDFGQYKVPLVVYWESSYTASQIASGKADTFLKSWASQMASYGQPIMFAPLDEMNGNWSPYFGNPSQFIAAWIHIKSLFNDPNVKFVWDPNNDPSNLMAAYFPGAQYVDICAEDGFDFGGQNWQSVFIADNSLPTLKAICPAKLLWILSTGIVKTDNQTQFLADMFAGAKTYGLSGFIYFDYQQFVLSPQALAAL